MLQHARHMPTIILNLAIPIRIHHLVIKYICLGKGSAPGVEDRQSEPQSAASHLIRLPLYCPRTYLRDDACQYCRSSSTLGACRRY